MIPHYLKSSKDFQRIFSKKNVLHSHYFVIHHDKLSSNNPQVGIIVSKKCGNAVKRNRLKRQIRSLLRDILKNKTLNFDLIIIAKPKMNNTNYITLKNNFIQLLGL